MPPDTRTRPAPLTPAEATLARAPVAAAFVADTTTREVIRGYVRAGAAAAGMPRPSDARCDQIALVALIDVLGPAPELP